VCQLHSSYQQTFEIIESSRERLARNTTGPVWRDCISFQEVIQTIHRTGNFSYFPCETLKLDDFVASVYSTASEARTLGLWVERTMESYDVPQVS
jgi:hypothetical protein